MQVESSRPERLAVGLGAKHGPVENVLSMYDSVEDFQKMSLDQFAQLGWDRVRVLQKFDELSSSSSSSTSTTATDDPGVAADSKRREVVRKHLHVKAQKRAFKSRHFDDEQLVLTTKMKDALSHFIVRLAYCRSAELRNWLLAQEVALFKYRFQTAGRKKQAEFVRSCGDLGKDCQVVTRDEFNQLHYDLYTATRAPEGAEAGADCFYKIKFEHVADLLRRRKVLMRGGWAFVERRDVVGMLAGIFRARLNKALVHLARKWPSFARVERDRLLPIVAQLTADRCDPVATLLPARLHFSFTSMAAIAMHFATRRKGVGDFAMVGLTVFIYLFVFAACYSRHFACAQSSACQSCGRQGCADDVHDILAADGPQCLQDEAVWKGHRVHWVMEETKRSRQVLSICAPCPQKQHCVLHCALGR